MLNYRADYAIAINIENEMPINKIVIMKQINEKEIVTDKTASNIWVRKAFISHGPIINAQNLIYIYFLVNFIINVKVSNKEHSIIKIRSSKIIAFFILSNFFNFNEIFKTTAKDVLSE